MRKNQDGYILVYVLVVILALSMFAVGLTSHALKNHNIQKNAVTYTQDKYVAEGMIEQFVAELEAFLIDEPLEVTHNEDASTEEIEATVRAASMDKLSDCVNALTPDNESPLCATTNGFDVSIEANSGQINVNAAIAIDLDIEINYEVEPVTYTIVDVNAEYTSYEISQREGP